LLRELAPVALDRFCSRVLAEAARIMGKPDATNHERYLELYRLMRARDKELAAAFDDHRRSRALIKLARIYSLGLLTEEELAGFSEGTRETVLVLLSFERE
jgi:hypothetical protein